MSALAHQLDRDTRGKGVDGPFESWEGDHTALVHVLWAARHQGLTLDKDADTIASMILRSRFLAARIDAAIAEHGCETAQAILRAEAEGHILNAQRFERVATAAREELDRGGHHPEHDDGLRLRASRCERLARDARRAASRAVERDS